jgi:hypothetical protein
MEKTGVFFSGDMNSLRVVENSSYRLSSYRSSTAFPFHKKYQIVGWQIAAVFNNFLLTSDFKLH